MMSKFENFIYTNDEALSERYCNKIIDFTNKNIDGVIKNQSISHPEEDLSENDPQFKLDIRDHISYYWSYAFVDWNFWNKITTLCNAELLKYIKEYPALVRITPRGMLNPEIKYHIVKMTGGYHLWHSEWTSQPPNDKRILVWHLSLTSHENEGELEFLYHKERIPPKAGRLIIFPAFFPWLHRGNAIRSDKEKHYLTGWYYTNS